MSILNSRCLKFGQLVLILFQIASAIPVDDIIADVVSIVVLFFFCIEIQAIELDLDT